MPFLKDKLLFTTVKLVMVQILNFRNPQGKLGVPIPKFISQKLLHILSLWFWVYSMTMTCWVYKYLMTGSVMSATSLNYDGGRLLSRT